MLPCLYTQRAILLAAALLALLPLPGSAQLAIRVDGPRPLHMAAEQLQNFSGIAVNYEDPAYAEAGDLELVKNEPGVRPKVREGFRFPRASKLDYLIPEDAQAFRLEDVERIARDLVKLHHEQGGAGWFRVFTAHGQVYIAPAGIRDAEGKRVEVTPLMETHLEAYEAPLRTETGGGAFVDLAQRISRRPRGQVSMGTLPIAAVAQSREEQRFHFSGGTAREAFTELVRDYRLQPGAYRLLYDENFGYMLNMRPVRKGSVAATQLDKTKPVQKPIKIGPSNGLFWAAMELQHRSGIVVNYEEPNYKYKGDLVTMVRALKRPDLARNDDLPRREKVPRFVSMEYEIPDSLTQFGVKNVATIAQAMVDDHHHRNGAGWFRVVCETDQVSIVPESVNDINGVRRPAASVMDAAIDPYQRDQTETLSLALADLVRRIAIATDVPVALGVGQYLDTHADQPKRRFQFAGGSAKSAFRQLIALYELPPTAYHILYTPFRGYRINIDSVGGMPHGSAD